MRDRCCGGLPALRACRQQDTAFVNARGEMRCSLWSQRWASRLAATKASARDRWKVPRQSPAPEVGMTSTVAPTKLSAGKSHCLYLCCLALPRDPRPGASSPGGADNLPEAVVTPYRSLRPQVFLALPNCIRHITPLPRLTASEP